MTDHELNLTIGAVMLGIVVAILAVRLLFTAARSLKGFFRWGLLVSLAVFIIEFLAGLAWHAFDAAALAEFMMGDQGKPWWISMILIALVTGFSLTAGRKFR